jgi:hypothetical protein
MQTTENIYSIGKVKQLIDLNGDSINFEVDFNVESESGDPFDILVVDQTTLDNNPKIDYKTADEGKISGSITNDKNVYQNYFLILKADKDIKCKVSISKKELPKTNFPLSKTTDRQSITSESERSIDWLKVGIVIAVIGGVCFLVYFMMEKQKNKLVIVDPPVIAESSISNRSPSASNELLTKMMNWKRSPSN